MGITIHYEGKIKDIKLLPELIDDCQDFAQNLNWKYDLIGEGKDEKIKGIILHIHPDCESLHLTFGEDGVLRSISDYHFKYLFVKTQFSGVRVHITIVKLLKYLKSRYIPNLKVYDEGEYWQTEDVNILSEKILFLQSMIDKLKGVFEKTEFTKEEHRDVYKLADRVEQILRSMDK